MSTKIATVRKKEHKPALKERSGFNTSSAIKQFQLVPLLVKQANKDCAHSNAFPLKVVQSNAPK